MDASFSYALGLNSGHFQVVDKINRKHVRCCTGHGFSGNLSSKVVVASIICFGLKKPTGSRERIRELLFVGDKKQRRYGDTSRDLGSRLTFMYYMAWRESYFLHARLNVLRVVLLGVHHDRERTAFLDFAVRCDLQELLPANRRMACSSDRLCRMGVWGRIVRRVVLRRDS